MKHGPGTQGPDDLFGSGPHTSRTPDGLGAPDMPEGPEASGLSPDELALRRMLHQAVDDIEPSDGTLDHLRHAVPARRARKRQAMVGMAAAAVFIGTAVPAVVHVSASEGSTANPSIAGQASQAQGGAGQDKSGDGAGNAGTAHPYDGSDADAGGPDSGPAVHDDPSAGTPAGGVPAATAAAVPRCAPEQLGPVTATLQEPDSSGAVYGVFRVTNVSIAGCTVGEPGTIGTATSGAADPAKVTVATHTAGDAASGLPDPSLSRTEVLLKPGTSYEVKFAWVPSATCPKGNGTGGGDGGGNGGGDGDGDPSPAPSESATQDTGAVAASGTTSSMAPQLGEGNGTSDGGVAVSFTPGPDSGPATVTLSNACAGTVYRTGLLETTAQ